MLIQFLADPLYLIGYTYTITSADGTKTEGDNIRVDATSHVVNVVSTQCDQLASPRGCHRTGKTGMILLGLSLTTAPLQ